MKIAMKDTRTGEKLNKTLPKVAALAVASLVAMMALMLTAGLLGCTGVGSSALSSDEATPKASSGSGDAGDSSASSSANTGSTVREGAPAPDFSYTTVDGVSENLSALKGSVVLLNFWASWCGPCVSEMPDIAALKADYPELEVLAVTMNDDAADARAFIADTGYSFKWVLDEKATIGALYPTTGIPYTIIIDKEGVVTTTFLGSPPNAYNTYETALKQAGL
ncbi:MAG: TlpA family protein disulfide reductase [Coriobacteriales bacterium]|jgi:thiol-disulfide isomerase/thioredoxin|nr:TlpA family protein disulfide reductase [Coriobacteriales bacterium]